MCGKGNTMKAKVFFTKNITPEAVLKLYETLGVKLSGKVAVKLHSGEAGIQNFLRPDFFKPMIDAVQGTVVECNTAYEGKRNTTEKHLESLKTHGWSEYFSVDLLDGEGEDIVLDIPNGAVIKKNYIGNHADRYDSMLVLSHFKGHPMGGYGGALKQLSIGVASSFGKAYIHGAGEPEKIWTADHDSFLRSMADAAGSVIAFYKNELAYINVMKNLSVDCDCCAVAEDPCMKDIGILASLDPVAVDQACLDLVYSSDDPGRHHLIERIESRNGALTVAAAAALGYGTKEYDLIEIDLFLNKVKTTINLERIMVVFAFKLFGSGFFCGCFFYGIYIEKNTERVGTAMAGDYAARSGDMDFVKIIQRGEFLMHRFENAVTATGMCDEYAFFIGNFKIFLQVFEIFIQSNFHFACEFFCYGHTAVANDDHRMKTKGVCHKSGESSASAAAGKICKRIDNEACANIIFFAFDVGDDVFRRKAFFGKFSRAENLESDSCGKIVRVNNEKSIVIFLFAEKLDYTASSAPLGGNTEENNIVAVIHKGL